MEEDKQAHSDTVPKLGVDVGGVIIAIGGNSGKEDTFFGEAYLVSDAVKGAFEGLSHIVSQMGCDNVYIVSKCGLAGQKKTSEWMQYNHFHETTGIKQDHVHFCVERHEKGPICSQLGITMFIDDREDVLGYVSKCPAMKKLFLFTGGAPGRTERRNRSHREKDRHHHEGEGNEEHHQHHPHHHHEKKHHRHSREGADSKEQHHHHHHHHHHKHHPRDEETEEHRHHQHRHEGGDEEHHHHHHHKKETHHRHRQDNNDQGEDGKDHHHHHRQHHHSKHRHRRHEEGEDTEIALPITVMDNWPALADAVVAEYHSQIGGSKL